jgi:hypothetical protein
VGSVVRIQLQPSALWVRSIRACQNVRIVVEQREVVDACSQRV